MSEEYQIFFFYVLYQEEQHFRWFFFSEYQIVFSFFSLLLSLSFFFGLSFLYLFQTIDRKRERERINRLCHSDILKMMFDNVFIRYLFILLLSAHLTVSQTTSTDFISDPSTGMLLILFDRLFLNGLRERRHRYMFFFVSMNMYQETDVLHLFV